jgi:hypothetical protein
LKAGLGVAVKMIKALARTEGNRTEGRARHAVFKRVMVGYLSMRVMVGYLSMRGWLSAERFASNITKDSIPRLQLVRIYAAR